VNQLAAAFDQQLITTEGADPVVSVELILDEKNKGFSAIKIKVLTQREKIRN